MILGIGIDAVDIARFTDFHKKSATHLSRLFTKDEIDYCLQNPTQSAQHFATRFAAKEAFLKALSNAYPQQQFALLTICKQVQVNHYTNNAPYLHINWEALIDTPTNTTAHLSLTHTDATATAFVILEKTK